MYHNLVTKDSAVVCNEVQSAYLAMFPSGNLTFIPQIFGWAIDCFTGRHAGYQAIDAKYHDLEHTLQGALCMSRILRERHLAQDQPVLDQKTFELGMVAILLHDTGYLKKIGDNTGTGAKYTVIHVKRSAEFANELLQSKGFTRSEISAVQNMILCTGLNAAIDKIPFQTVAERIAGFALGAADLLGQMAADDYVEKLPVLYSEFAEAASQDSVKPNSVSMFSSAEDLMQKTPAFWEKYVKPKLDKDFASLQRFLDNTGPNGSNYYLNKIESNIEQLKRRLSEREARSSVSV
jgi:hypothetical protein